MSFLSPVFPVFLLGSWIVFAAAPRHLRQLVLVIASLIFYGWVEPQLALLLVLECIAAWGFGHFHFNRRDKSSRVAMLLSAVVLCLPWLLFLHPKTRVSQPDSGVVLFGAAFFCLQAVGYLVAVARGRMAPQSLMRVSAFLAFFPQLVVGPIERAQELCPQFDSLSVPPPRIFASGVVLILLGIALKVVVADRLGGYFAILAANPQSVHPTFALLAMMTETARFYADFLGYSTIALGTARLFGVNLTMNFDRPFRSGNPTLFWMRWNLTFNRWLREHIFVPATNLLRPHVRRPRVATFAGLFAAFVFTAFWHGGGSQHFVWAGLHLAAVTLWPRRATGVVAIMALALFMILTGVISVSPDVGSALNVFRALANPGWGSGRHTLVLSALSSAIIAIALVEMVLQRLLRPDPPSFRLLVGAAAVATFAVVALRAPSPAEFVYHRIQIGAEESPARER